MLLSASQAGPASAGLKMWTSNASEINITALAIDPADPSTIYADAGTADGGVIKSTDGGGNWEAVNAGLPTNDYYRKTTGSKSSKRKKE